MYAAAALSVLCLCAAFVAVIALIVAHNNRAANNHKQVQLACINRGGSWLDSKCIAR